MATCNDFLNFEPTMNPSWRDSTQTGIPNTLPPVDEMLRDIYEYQKIYKEHKDSIDQSLRIETIRKFLIMYMLNVQMEEEIGVQDYGKTKEIIGKYEDGQSVIITSKLSNVSEYEKSVADSNNTSADEIDQTPQSHWDIPNFPSLGDTEKELLNKRNIYISGCDGLQQKSELDISNLYKAYTHLAEDLYNSQQESTKTNECAGTLDVESCIEESHKILMVGVTNDDKTEKTSPGTYSTNTRVVTFDGKTHVYPQFDSEDIASDVVHALVDKYNEMTKEIRESKLPTDKKLEYYFKCANVFLFGFLYLHPFGDGNGRLGRLLASYNLLTMTPFMTPIYNVFSSSKQTDYMDALVKARGNLEFKEPICSSGVAKNAVIEILKHQPKDLCAMMIESNWTIWRQFLTKLGILQL